MPGYAKREIEPGQGNMSLQILFLTSKIGLWNSQRTANSDFSEMDNYYYYIIIIKFYQSKLQLKGHAHLDHGKTRCYYGPSITLIIHFINKLLWYKNYVPDTYQNKMLSCSSQLK